MPDLDGLRDILRQLWGSESAQLSPGSPSLSHREKIRLVVGFDFGTSTSKVIVAAKAPRTDQISRSAVSVDGRALIPTIASRIDHRISFRPQAQGNPIWRSFKSCLNRSLANSTLAKHIHQGTGLAPEVLCFGYLSYLADQVKKHIAVEWPESRYEITECIWAMGAPIGFGTWNEEADRYRRILQAAVDHPAPLDADVAASGGQLKQAYKFATSANTLKIAMCHVLPEALVAISAYVLSTNGRIDPGMYCLADIGAGTTDVTWFRHESRDASTPMRIYSGASSPVAGDKINTALAQVNPKSAHSEWLPIPGLLAEPLEDLLREVAQTRSDGMAQIGRKEPITTFLEAPVSLVLMGGGRKIDCLSTALSKPVLSRHQTAPRARFATTHLQPAKLAVGATDLHALALGLSYHPGEHPGFLDRHEIADWQPQLSGTPEFMDHNMIDD